MRPHLPGGGGGCSGFRQSKLLRSTCICCCAVASAYSMWLWFDWPACQHKQPTCQTRPKEKSQIACVVHHRRQLVLRSLNCLHSNCGEAMDGLWAYAGRPCLAAAGLPVSAANKRLAPGHIQGVPAAHAALRAVHSRRAAHRDHHRDRVPRAAALAQDVVLLFRVATILSNWPTQKSHKERLACVAYDTLRSIRPVLLRAAAGGRIGRAVRQPVAVHDVTAAASQRNPSEEKKGRSITSSLLGEDPSSAGVSCVYATQATCSEKYPSSATINRRDHKSQAAAGLLANLHAREHLLD